MQDLSPTPPADVAKVSPANTPGVSELMMLAVFVVVVTGLYFAREVMVPITLAVLLSFVLAPVVAGLRRIHLPRVPAVLLSVVLSLGVILALGGLIGMQMASLASDLPRYQDTVEAKIGALQSMTLGRLSELMARIGPQVQPAARPARPPPSLAHSPSNAPAAPAAPMEVQIREQPLSPLQLAREVLVPVVAPLATGAIVFVVAILILLQKDDLRDRLIRLFGSNDLHRTTLAMDDAGRRLSRYFLTQLGINAGFGCVVCAGLLLIGVPSPVLWGITGALLRFVPYIGSWLSALLPVALAAAVDPGWSMVLWTMALYAVVELLAGQVIEPFMYGHSTGLSPISVVVAAIFWSWLWGPIGLILSTPLTLCLVVLGRHVSRLEFLDVLLGDRPALTPVESLYQRLLAGDADEALAQAEQMLRDRPLSSYYDEVVLKALRLAAADIDRGTLPPERAMAVLKTVLEVVADLEGYDDRPGQDKESDAAPVSLPDREALLPQQPAPGPDFEPGTHPGIWNTASPILCVAGRGPLDEAAAAMLAQLLGKHGLGAHSAPHAAVTRGRVTELEAAETAMVCLCYVQISGNPAHLRYLLRRVRQHLPQAVALVGLWPQSQLPLLDERLRVALGADHTTSSLTETVNTCLRAARTTVEPAIQMAS
jgi:predicted PurR-regulated permease PerM